MLLILTHERADFDAVAAQLAAYKLFPDGTPLLPQIIRTNVQNFLALYWDTLPFMRAHEWQPERVDAAMLVDTHLLPAMRGITYETEVRVIDNQLSAARQDDWQYQVELLGATTTILTEQIRDSGLVLSAEEATLLLLGIYEETGALLYDVTTQRDVLMTAWLLEQGAQLAVVRRFLQMPLSKGQEQLYGLLQQQVSWQKMQGQDVAIAYAEAPATFDEELLPIVHQLREALTPNVLLCFVKQRNMIHFVGRSNSEQVNVALLAEALGGSGHMRAASAQTSGQTLTAVLGKVQQLLPAAIEPAARVATLMSYRVKTFHTGLTVHDVAEEVRQLGYEGYPVVDEAEQVCGLLTRRALDRALAHGLSHLTVNQIMKRGSFTVRPTDPVDQVQLIMELHGWGQVPVVDENGGQQLALVGIVTRTDMLDYLFKRPKKTADSNLKQLLTQQLPYPIWQMVRNIEPIVTELQMPLYFVGGPVRDLILGRQFNDLDIVVEGPAAQLVQRLCTHFGGTMQSHERFGTVKWLLDEAVWQKLARPNETVTTSTPIAPLAFSDALPMAIDFVTARTEFYRYPSALPEVISSSIKRDLQRRDFTMNALAVRLDGAHFGEMLDFYNGRRDLQKKLVRVLHSLSFIDDPTRLLRAVRFEQRLGFMIASNTLHLISPALPLLAEVSGDRLRHEIELILTETEAAAMFARLDELKIFAHVVPKLGAGEETAVLYERLEALAQQPVWEPLAAKERPFIRLALWLNQQSDDVHQQTLERLSVSRQATQDSLAVSAQLAQLTMLPADAPPSKVVRVVAKQPARVLLTTAVLASSPHIIQWLEQYLSKWRDVKTAVTGNHLKAKGLPPGPHYAVILQALHDAWLDKAIQTAEEEKALLNTLITKTKSNLNL